MRKANRFLTGIMVVVVGGYGWAAESDVKPGPKVFQGTNGVFLVMDGARVCGQMPDGRIVSASRPLAMANRPDRFELLRFGKPTGATVETGGDALEWVKGDGSRARYAATTNAPEPIGWQPYELPAVTSDSARRRAIAEELKRRFDNEQRLRGEVMKLTKGAMDREAMSRPDVRLAWEKASAADEDNRVWLEKTLRADGWIGRKTYGDETHQALVLIAIHNVHFARFAATVLANLQAEFKRGEIPEMAVASIADRIAITMNEPMQYGMQGMVDEKGQAFMPVLADVALVNTNRSRIGQPSLASMAQQTQARIIRIGPDGRLVGEGPGPLRGLEAVDLQRALRDPAWGVTAVGEAEPELRKAITEARQGNHTSLTKWTRNASSGDRQLLSRILLSPGSTGADAEAAICTNRALFEGLLAGLPADERQTLGLMLANSLAYGLVARQQAPTEAELKRAVELASELEEKLERKEFADSPVSAGVFDTLACIRYRQANLTEAAKLWRRAITVAGSTETELFQKRLAVAEAGDAAAALPREKAKGAP